MYLRVHTWVILTKGTYESSWNHRCVHLHLVYWWLLVVYLRRPWHSLFISCSIPVQCKPIPIKVISHHAVNQQHSNKFRPPRYEASSSESLTAIHKLQENESIVILLKLKNLLESRLRENLGSQNGLPFQFLSNNSESYGSPIKGDLCHFHNKLVQNWGFHKPFKGLFPWFAVRAAKGWCQIYWSCGEVH